MTFGIQITRQSLSLTNLQLNDPNQGLQIVSFGPGSRIMRLEHARSPVSDGSILTGSTADLQIAFLTVRCYGSNENQIIQRLETIERALNQWSYDIYVNLGANQEIWKCQPANHARGLSGVYQAETLKVGWQDITAEIPRQPSAYSNQ